MLSCHATRIKQWDVHKYLNGRSEKNDRALSAGSSLLGLYCTLPLAQWACYVRYETWRYLEEMRSGEWVMYLTLDQSWHVFKGLAKLTHHHARYDTFVDIYIEMRFFTGANFGGWWERGQRLKLSIDSEKSRKESRRGPGDVPGYRNVNPFWSMLG